MTGSAGTNGGMRVREARPGESDKLRELLSDAYGQYAGAVAVRALFDHYLAGVLDVDGSPEATVLVAELDGGIAGTARFHPAGTVPFLPGEWAWVRAVGVRPGLRRAGVGRALMADGLRRAADGGAQVLSLHTMAFMPDAVRMYERLGYRRAPEHDIDLAHHYGVGGEMVALAYRLDLPPGVSSGH